MVDVHIAGRGIRDHRVLAAMRRVPREAFVDAGFEEFAYEDNPLPIGEQQTISQPYIVALMLEAAEIGEDDSVLEIGAGSGYAAAIAAQLAKRVCAIERHASLVATAAERIRKLGYSNIELRQGDGTLGWPGGDRFDVILVAAGGTRIPLALKRQLKTGGRLVIPVGGPDEIQELVKLTKRAEDDFEEEHLGAVRFVLWSAVRSGSKMVAVQPRPISPAGRGARAFRS
jgi:protein-L-isoaspartate(D-aspartate) O-methyltransferase